MIRYKQTLYVSNAAELPSVADDGQLAFLLDTQSTVSFTTATSSWTPLGRQMVFKSEVQVNAKTVATTPIYTLPASPLYFYPTGIIMRAVNVSGAGTNPSITLGTNASTYDNIATSSLISTILGLIDVNNGAPMMGTFSPGLAGGSVIRARVAIAAALFTNYTVKFDILGFYDSTSP